jgi:hypothetical protein
VLGIESKVEQGIVVRSRHHHHIAAASAIATAGSAARNELLAPERKDAVAAVSSFDGNDDFIYEQHGMHRAWKSAERERLFGGHDADELAHASAVAKLNDARDLGE